MVSDHTTEAGYCSCGIAEVWYISDYSSVFESLSFFFFFDK
jgi:hypothetical protein